MKVGCASADLEDLLVGGLEEAVADAVSVQPPGEVFQAELALEVAAALGRAKSGMRIIGRHSMGMGAMDGWREAII